MSENIDFSCLPEAEEAILAHIRKAAHELHAAVNQSYGGGLPYAYHLDGVAGLVARYGGEVCAQEADVLPIMFGAWFHDSIEDARQTYNDIRKRARSLGLDERQSLMAAEIVYALTNDKGRTRAERAGEKYYAGIRATPYAPLVKMAMARVYREEFPHFLQALRADTADVRLRVPDGLVEQVRRDLGLV